MEAILVIDDEAKLHRILEISLEGLGYNVRTASTGSEGIDIAKSSMPSLVITDMKMPGMSGMEVLQEIKKMDSEVPVIIMTAYGTVQSAVEAMKAGAIDYILKPFDISEMEMIVEKALDTVNYPKRTNNSDLSSTQNTASTISLGNLLPCRGSLISSIRLPRPKVWS